MTAETLVVVDGHYCAYRFFFGMPSLAGPGGRPTGVTYRFAELFRSLRDDPAITHVALVLDHPDPSFRHEIFPDYKAHRDPMPDALRPQIDDVERLAEVNRIPLLKISGYEADDVIANLALRAADAGMDVRICTRDKDLDQVIGERIKTWEPANGKLRGPEELAEEKDIRPDQVIDYLCMIGDTSDNIPGIKGVGPKTAVKLLKEYGSLPNLLEHAEELKGKRRENVLAFRDKAELTRRLITIPEVSDLPDPHDLEKVPALSEDARPFYEELGFSLAKHFKREVAPASAGEDYRILGGDGLDAYLDELRAAGRFAVDTETTSLDPLEAELVGVSFAFGDDCGHTAAYLPIRGAGYDGLVEEGRAITALRPLLEDPSVGKVAQNGKYDLRVFARHGIHLAGFDGDPMLASWLLDPARESHGLDYLTYTFLGETKIPTSQVVDLVEGQTMADAPVERVARYACEDAHCTWRLARLLEEKLEEEHLLWVYREQELPIAACLAAMEQVGMPVDRTVLAEKQEHLERYLEQVLAEIREIAGPDFNPASPKQVGAFLFDKLGLPVIRKTKSGPSTDAAVLAALRHEHELPDLLLQHRTLSKLVTSYLRTLPDTISPVDGRIHTNLRQTGTETGRLSSEHPNLQNIPKKTDLGREIRAAFRADEGRVLLAADYSQIELRVLAHFSGDEALRAAFAEEADIHRFVAAQIEGCDEDDVSPSMRNAAKAVNFGIIYGQSAFGLSQQLGITRPQAQAFIDDYFARFGQVRDYIDAVVEEASGRGYVETLSGRRRYVPALASHNRNELMQGRRTALNSTIQGSAADVIKLAMIRCRERLPNGAALVLQIHDELIVECDDAIADGAAEALRDAMVGSRDLAVPLVADVRRGRDWLSVS